MANVRTTLIGGTTVTEEQVRATDTPPETRSHVPLPHGEFLDMVDSTLGGFGWDITEQRYALEGGKIEVGGEDVRYDSARLFGVLKIQREDVQLVGWDTVVERNVLVSLDNEHWAWGNQIRPSERGTA